MKGISMQQLVISLAVGLAIGVIFKLLKLPVPVPHGLGGLIGLVGMFIGSEVVAVVIQSASSK